MRLAIVTDAWLPQTKGVVRTLPCPTYPEIRLAWRPYPRTSREHARRYTWPAATGQFLEHLVRARQGDPD